jgi:tRNA threonylcarbamoyladenosine modification (KEOPS) complex  Pcc1 subunit
MAISATITVYDREPEKLSEIFQPEISKKDRSGFSISKEKDCLKFIIGAEDSVALRATLNIITKLLTAYEKAREAV